MYTFPILICWYNASFWKMRIFYSKIACFLQKVSDFRQFLRKKCAFLFSSIFQVPNVWKELTWYLMSPVYAFYISNAPRRKMRIFKTPRDISIYGRFRFSIIFCWRITTKHARVYRKAHLVTRYIFCWYIWNSTKKCAFLLLKTMKHPGRFHNQKQRHDYYLEKDSQTTWSATLIMKLLKHHELYSERAHENHQEFWKLLMNLQSN